MVKRELAGLSKRAFHDLLGDRKVERHYTETELDEKETAAITYAIESDAGLVLIDERDGRRVARRHDLRVTGVIGM